MDNLTTFSKTPYRRL